METCRFSCYASGRRRKRYMYMTMIIPRRVKWKIGRIGRVKYSEIIADNLKKAGWSCDYVATVDYEGQTIWRSASRQRNITLCGRMSCRPRLEIRARCLSKLWGRHVKHGAFTHFTKSARCDCRGFDLMSDELPFGVKYMAKRTRDQYNRLRGIAAVHMTPPRVHERAT
jgi:hypothetical protein